MSRLSVAATQMACSWDLPANLDHAEHLIREAAAKGAQIILIQELCETPYFTDHTGALMSAADEHGESVLVHEFDMEAIRDYRNAWGVYRDRRPDLYETISTLDGAARSA
jgi:predicted amidohydrolase